VRRFGGGGCTRWLPCGVVATRLLHGQSRRRWYWVTMADYLGPNCVRPGGIRHCATSADTVAACRLCVVVWVAVLRCRMRKALGVGGQCCVADGRCDAIHPYGFDIIIGAVRFGYLVAPSSEPAACGRATYRGWQEIVVHVRQNFQMVLIRNVKMIYITLRTRKAAPINRFAQSPRCSV
jgi:hypothetical protein